MATRPYFRSFVLLLYFFGALAACVPTNGFIMRVASASVVEHFEQFATLSLRLLPEGLVGWCNFVLSPLQQRLIRLIHGQLGIWDMVQLLAACTLLQVWRLWKHRQQIAVQQDRKACAASSCEGRHSHGSVAGSYDAAEEASASGESQLVELGKTLVLHWSPIPQETDVPLLIFLRCKV